MVVRTIARAVNPEGDLGSVKRSCTTASHNWKLLNTAIRRAAFLTDHADRIAKADQRSPTSHRGVCRTGEHHERKRSYQ